MMNIIKIRQIKKTIMKIIIIEKLKIKKTGRKKRKNKEKERNRRKKNKGKRSF